MKSFVNKFGLGIMVLFFILPSIAGASAVEYSQFFYAADVADGAYLGSLDNQFYVSFSANTFDRSLSVYINESTVPDMPVDENLGKVYSYYILSQQSPAKEFELAFRFTSDSIQSKHIWHYDYKKNVWQKLYTRVDQPGRLAIAMTDMYFGKVILAEDEPVSVLPGEQIVSFDKNFSIELCIDFDDKVDVESYNMNMYPESLPRVSSIYQYDMHLDQVLTKPIKLIFDYEINNWQMPTAYFWNKSKMTWQELETTAKLENNKIHVSTVLPFSRVALFLKPDVWAGQASWYKYKNCNCAASRDYPKGTELKLTHLSTGKTELITVNDYGPELWTGRIIDLDATVFKKFIGLGAGVTDLRVELVQ